MTNVLMCFWFWYGQQAKGIGSTVKGVAIEAFGEVQTLANDVKTKGLKGLVTYFQKL